MKCQFCSAENPSGDQFCGNCGARMPVPPAEAAPTPAASGPVSPSKCQFCGADLPAGDQFCGRCGARQSDAPGRVAASGVGAGVGAAPRPWEGAGYGAYDSATPAHRYAGFWIRFGAYLLDTLFSLLVALIPAIVGLVVAIALVEAGQEPPRTAFEADQQDEDTAVAAVIGFFIGAIPFLIGYWYVATALGGGWGKRICGIRIIKMDSGERPGWGAGAIRYGIIIGMNFVPFVGGLVWLVDHLSMLWDKDKQTFHDKAAGTVVVRV